MQNDFKNTLCEIRAGAVLLATGVRHAPSLFSHVGVQDGGFGVWGSGLRVHLTECMNSLVLESQPPHKVVNLSFTIADLNNKFEVLWGS